MSSLLEQAIIDASALKDAAVKNAETAILNKYSNDIREAVEDLLEQEDEIIDNAEATATPDIELAGAPDVESGEEVITLNLESLKELAETLSEEDQELVGDQYAHTAASDEEAQIATPEQEVEETSVDLTLEEEKEIDLEDLDSILEELVVDIDPRKSGWAGTPGAIMDYKEEMELAHRSSTEAREKAEELQAAVERLSEENEILKDKNTKIIGAFNALKENFDKVNLSNARLLYTNRTLTNDSLNERQKLKIVEALSNAVSIEEAKVIFETLESAVGSVSGKARPQSLRETVERPSATLPRRAPARNVEAPVMDRMQILAGIKKN
jgi:hypothetical protein